MRSPGKFSIRILSEILRADYLQHREIPHEKYSDSVDIAPDNIEGL